MDHDVIAEMERELEKIYGPLKPYRPRKRGYVYFIQAEHGGPIKVGWARDPNERLRSLQTAHPYGLQLLKAVRGTLVLEKRLHRKFAEFRLRGEWFEDCDELRAEIASRPGLSGWDLEAEAALGLS